MMRLDSESVDISEDDIFALSPLLLSTLLKDHTLSTPGRQVNIFWATDDYAHLGEGFGYNDQISIECITGEYGNVIVPRAVKSRARQQQRARQMAEVFTPSWICNRQNNLVDAAWFGREDVFNTETSTPCGDHSWVVNPEPVAFPQGRTWRDYVREARLEVTCGEAPYLVSRYDTVSGEPIEVGRRIGLLDRKLRIVSEQCHTPAEWLRWAQTAYQNTYGFEWQGDNLVLAREALLYTFLDHYRAKFGKDPMEKSLLYIAYIISWNLWQMDGLKGVIPGSCGERRREVADLFGTREEVSQCRGCKDGDMHHHNGTYALIKDWGAPKAKQKLRFIDLMK